MDRISSKPHTLQFSILNRVQKHKIFFFYDLLPKLGYTVAPAKAGVQQSPKNLDSVFRRNDDRELFQEALEIPYIAHHFTAGRRDKVTEAQIGTKRTPGKENLLPPTKNGIMSHPNSRVIATLHIVALSIISIAILLQGLPV